MGLDGFYLLTDKQEQALGLPNGDYDIPMALTAKQYGTDGQLIYDTHNHTGLWGDIIQVYEDVSWHKCRN
jgi:bilirubin oxidase